MHVLYICNCITLGGGNRSLLDMVDALKGDGVIPYFIFPLGGSLQERGLLRQELETRGFSYAFLSYEESVHREKDKNWYRIFTKQKRNRAAIQRMKTYVIKWKIDLIHSNSMTLMIGAQLAEAVKKPHIWHIREAVQEAYGYQYDRKAAYRYYLRRAKKIICISPYVKSAYRGLLKASNVSVLYNGLAIDRYLQKKRFAKDFEIKNLLIAGTICENKGQMDAVLATERIIKKYKDEKVHLYIAGNGEDAYFHKMQKHIQENNLTEYITVLPFQKELGALREKTDIALICSRSEAFGRTTIESMLSGSLVVGCNSTGTKELIQDGVTGYLYEPGDVDELAQKLINILKNWEAQEKIVNRAKAYACQHFDNRVYAESIKKLYDDVME